MLIRIMYITKFLLKLICSLKKILIILFAVTLCVIWHTCIINDIRKYLGKFDSLLDIQDNYQKRIKYITRPKYILLWQPYYLINSNDMTWTLQNYNCSISDCVLTKNRNLMSSISLFDAIIFNEGILNSKATSRPEQRAISQIYIFTTIESSHHYPSCEIADDNFFNWTVTYRLDSDIVWNYFLVKNNNGTIIAPSINVAWKNNTDPVKPKVKQILINKTKSAAWLVSNCNAESLRNDYLMKLQDHLYHFSIKIDIYGTCTKVRCDNNDCEEMIRRDYYFYMAFENSFSEDYVTEKVLHGYRNYAVPIVYGGANYTRFLPPGSYINAREIHPYNLAYLIFKSMHNQSFYESFFKWTNLYTISSYGTDKNDAMCDVCEALHDDKALQAPVKDTFRFWWNGLNGLKWCLSKEYWRERNQLNIEGEDDFILY